MRAYWVHVEHDFAKPPERIFAHLAEHENLADVGPCADRPNDAPAVDRGLPALRRAGRLMVSVEAASEQAGSVGRAAAGEVRAMAGVLARAFHEDPAFGWVLRGDERRMKILERGFELFLRRVWIKHEETYTTAGTVAVAAWGPPGQLKG